MGFFTLLQVEQFFSLALEHNYVCFTHDVTRVLRIKTHVFILQHVNQEESFFVVNDRVSQKILLIHLFSLCLNVIHYEMLQI